MANPATDDWGQGVPVADTAGAQDQWGTGIPVNENDVGAFTGDQAQEAVQTYAPGAQVTSSARTPQRNAQVGGVPDSMHMGDQAVDVVLPKGMTAEQFRAKLVAQGYPITEFINEGNHVHWGWGAKGGQGPGQDPWGVGQPVGGKPILTAEDNANIDALHAAGKTWVDQQRAPQPPPSTDIPQAGPDATQANLDQASKFYGGIWKSIKAGVQATPAAWTAFTGAMMRFAGEHPGAILPAEAAAAPALGAAVLPPAEQDKTQKAMDAMGEMGAAINAEATKRVNEFAPKASAPDSEKLAFQITRSTIDLLPVLAGTELTANPVVGATMIAGQTYVQKYGEARAAGRSADQAALDSAFSATVNGSLGGLPLGVLMKPGSSFLGKTVQSAASFGAISVMTEALQIGYDKGLINPNMTLKEAWGRLEEAGITGTLQGALLGGGHAALESAVNRYMASNKPPAPRVEPTAAAAPPPPPAPAPEPPKPAPASSLAAQVRTSLGLDRPGRPPAVDEWGRGTPLTPAEAAAASQPTPAGEALQREFPKVPRPAPEAAQIETGGISRRVVAPDVAVTSTGREVPVHYAVVEAGHLVPSQTQEGNVNPNYPAELQPRDRTRAVSQAQVATIAQNINPRLLDKSPNASDGAPIVAPSGVVESGNGRTLAIQRAYEQNMQSAYQYRQYLLDQGYPVEGMDAPMLVRVRTDPMSPEDRQAFVREANQAGQLGYSATERAMSDAAALPDRALELYRGGDVESAANRPFVRMFLDRAISQNEHAGMIAADGTLSQEAIRRVRAALLAKAYADHDLVAAVNESQDNNVKAIGGALTDAAGDWARMRSGAANGEIPAAMDQTGKLLAAVKLVDRARADGRNVAEFVNQKDIFSGEALDPDVEAWLRLMFRNTRDWTQPVGRDKLADSLRFYTQEAQKAQTGPSLLGGEPVQPSEILALAKAKQNGQVPPESGPSLRFGEDTGAHGGPGGRAGFQSPEAGGSSPVAPGGASGRFQVTDDFGPSPRSFTTNAVLPGERRDLTSEARFYVAKAGAGTPLEKVGALANWVAQRGRSWGFESFAAISARNDMAASTGGQRNAVELPAAVKNQLLRAGEHVVTVHNHPSGGSFSGGDLATLIAPGHAAMVVVAHDGNWHVVSVAAKFEIGNENKSTWRNAGNALKEAQERARAWAISWTDALYNDRKVNGNEANAIVSHVQMTALNEAGLVNYQGTDVVPERYRKDVQDVAQKIAASLRGWVARNPQFGLRPADAPYRPAAAVQLADGLQGVLERAGRYAGFTGSPQRAPAGAGGPAPYVAPRQLRLLEDENRYEAERPPFYSALTRSVENLGLNRAPSKDWLGAIENLKTKGVKNEEIDWSGVRDWLKDQTGPVSKDAVLQHLRENEVKVQEVQHGAPTEPPAIAAARERFQQLSDKSDKSPLSDAERAEMDAARQVLDKVPNPWLGETTKGKFGSYALPGGENYRELLLTLPRHGAEDHFTAYRDELEKTHGPIDSTEAVNRLPAAQRAEFERRREAANAEYRDGKDFRSSHFDEPNVVVHIRFDDRTGPNGEKVLHVAEIQSDWHQKGRREGYQLKAGPQYFLRKPDGDIGQDFASLAEGEEYLRRHPGAGVIDSQAPYTEGVPNAPFKSSWHELAMRRMLRYAAESGSHAWDEVTEPERPWEKAQHILGGELAAVTPLKVMDVPVLDGLQNNQIRERVVEAIPVNVVHMLAKAGFSADQFTSDPKVVGDALSVPVRAAVARGFARALELVGARERATLCRVLLAPEPGGGDREALAAVRAVNLHPRIVGGLLAPSRLYGFGGDVPLTRTRGALVSTESAISGLDNTGKRTEPTTTELASALNRHEEIVTGQPSNAIAKYAPGYERLSWDRGETQADRYDLSKHISNVLWYPKEHGYLAPIENRLEAYDVHGNKVIEKTATAEQLPDLIGKEAADRLIRAQSTNSVRGRVKQLRGLDLKVGGEGMRGFYDKILPDFVRKYTKKWGAKVEDGTVPAPHGMPDNAFTVEQNRRGEYEVRNVETDEVVKTFGLPGLANELKRKLNFEAAKKATVSVHQVEITPEMRRSVMEGQPLFEDKPRYETEPGALDARGRPVDQTILPGAEPSAVQLAKAREAAGGGKMGTKVQQKPPGELFGAQGVPGDDQLSLFEDEKRYNDEIPKDDRDALEKAARTGNWVGRFQATGADAEERIRASIAGAYAAWKKVGTSVPMRVREIFRSISGGGGGSGKPPITFNDVPSERPGPSFGMQVRNTANKIMDIGNDILMHVTPMSQGSVEARAAAKTFANMIRLARWHGNRMMEMLKKNFTPDELRRMWEAADEESVLRQQGQPTDGRGLSRLTPKQRRAVLEQQTDAQNVWNAAINEGMVEGEGLPSYVPRMMVELAGGEVSRLGSSDEARSIPGIGRNVRTSTPQMKQRKHLTTEETEAAASTKFGTIANVVKDIRTLPLATMHLRQAVAGRALINRIKEAGRRIGEDLVVEGHEPTGSPFKWFTMDSPAFKKWRPALVKNEESGKYEQAIDQNGTPQWEKVPIYVRADFEGPLRAVLSTDTGAAYRALMSMKGRAMTAIMYSPLIHNMVEWGRAFPGAPGKVLTGIIYFQGNRAKNDPETMTEAIMHGLVPIGHQAGMQDITSMANPDSIAPGRSWTAKLLGAIPGLFSRDAQQSVYRTVDAMGDLWHNTLLWDRVGDLQMGLYVHFRDNLVKKGVPQDVASYVAAHFANRYAGALPLESMSNMARKIANVSMFSRTYTLGNLGAMKDMITGLPRDVQAQIEQKGGLQQLKGVRSMAMRKAISIFLIDTSLFYASNAIFHSAISYIAGRQDLSDIEKGYVNRLMALSGKIEESPIQLLHLFDNLQSLSPTSENEAGRENRVLVGYDKDGTAIYGRVVVGKIGEEFTNWLSSPIKTAISKMSTFLKPAYQLVTNDSGFGRHLYDPNAKGFTGIAHNLGNIVANYFEDQIPIDSLKSAFNVLAGKGTKLDVYKTVGPLAGVTFSKGATGGPAVGEMYNIRREHDAAVAAAMPGIVEKIKGGDIAGARKAMHDLGMAPGLINYYVRVTLNPRLRLNTKTNRQLIRTAPPEERARINALRGATP